MKIRCSQLGRFMGGFERPKEALTDDAKSLLQEMAIFDKYGIEQIVDSKEMQKGREVEEQSITLLSKVTNTLYVKNRETFENEYIKGTPDLKPPKDYVIDIKSPYNIFTFANAQVTSSYAWQLMGYMWLTSKQVAKLAYCLVDAPEHIMSQEFKRVCYMTNTFQGDDNELYLEYEAKVRKLMSYPQIPAEKRIKIFEIQRDEAKIEMIKAKYALATEYYQTFIESI